MTTRTSRPPNQAQGHGHGGRRLNGANLKDVLVAEDVSGPEMYPRMWNRSAGFLYQAVLRTQDPQPAEYVTVPQHEMRRVETAVAVAQWNMMWEAAQFRRRVVGGDELPRPLERIAERGDVNVVFVPRTRARYYEYAPLFHLLPAATMRRHGLPTLHGEGWPFLANYADVDSVLPPDFDARLSRAWAGRVWRYLWPQSPPSAFSRDDPVRVLSHNLDFWLPPVTEAIQEELRTFPAVDNGTDEGPVYLDDGSRLDGAMRANPRMGGDIWRGEQEADEMVERVVAHADADGRLRRVLDAVRAHRVADDFSDRWSRSREDFERQLYRKRSRVQVSFVELPDTIPVHGPESEVIGDQVCADFMALLDPVDRRVVVLLSSGMTKIGDVAQELGYRNHSAVSKRLARIRAEATRFFDQTS